jgi:hypothetical protein
MRSQPHEGLIEIDGHMELAGHSAATRIYDPAALLSS